MAGIPRIRTYVIAVIVGLSSLLLAACGSGAEAAEPPAVEPTATTQVIQVTPAPPATATTVPPTAVKVTEERTEDEQAVFELWDAQRVNFFNQQYARFLEGCPPEFTKPISEIEAEITGDMAARGLTIANMSYSQPKIVQTSGITALIEFSILLDGEYQFTATGFYTKLDDTWYRDCESSAIASSPTHTPAKIESV
jgi:hypothetical protein